jgi:hypothetical protein
VGGFFYRRGAADFFLKRNVITFFNPLICVYAKRKVSSASYRQDCCWFFSSTSDSHESLGDNHEQADEAQVASFFL